MSHFQIQHTNEEAPEEFFDRQQLITWWDQQRLRDARVMVVGAGAIGNEVLKNLALLGVGYFFVVDFDTIAPSNLSRTVLFRTTDVGQKKAEIAAERTRDLLLEPTAGIDWFHGDLVWELGTGFFRRMDLVLGCVDNVEARLAINRQCWLARIPWIDAGIHELAGHVSVFAPPDSACYECAVTPGQLTTAQRRYSCDNFKRRFAEEGRAATVQVASALVGALQVQEAVKLLCERPVAAGKTLLFQGTVNDFDVISLVRKANCAAHASYPEPRPLEVSASTSLRELLEQLSSPTLVGPGARIDLSADRSFVLSIQCRTCSRPINLYRPQFRIYDTDTFCTDCSGAGEGTEPAAIPVDKEVLQTFDLQVTPDRVLDMTLNEIGIPPLHVLPVEAADGSYYYVELTGDLASFLPALACRERSNP